MMVRTRKEITKGEITGKASRIFRQIFDNKEKKKNKVVVVRRWLRMETVVENSGCMHVWEGISKIPALRSSWSVIDDKRSTRVGSPLKNGMKKKIKTERKKRRQTKTYRRLTFSRKRLNYI